MTSPQEEFHAMISFQNAAHAQNGKGSSTKKRALFCDYCGEEGHDKNECPHDEENERKKKSKYGRYDRHESIESEGSDI